MEKIYEDKDLIVEKNSSNEVFIKTKAEPKTVIRLCGSHNGILFCTNGLMSSRRYAGSNGYFLENYTKGLSV